MSLGCLRRRTMRRAERVDMDAEYARRTAASSAALLSDIRESLAELGTTGPPVLTKQDALRLIPGQ